MKVKTGTYTGTGSSASITGVGFQPDLVILEAETGGTPSHMRTSAMGANESIQPLSDSMVVTDGITTLDSDGFTVGTSSYVCASAVVYFYIAIKDDGAGDFKVGTYTGTGADGKVITGLGFQPDFVHVKANATIVGSYKYATGTDTSMHFNGDNRSDLIVSLDSDGFTVNDGSGSGANMVNVSAAVHYYWAMKVVAGFSSVFQYTGNGVDDRALTTPGFAPEFVILKSQWGGNPSIRTSAHVGDNSQSWDSAQAPNGIQSFTSTGFTIGTSDDVNQTGALFNALVVKEGASGGGGGVSNRQYLGFF